MEENRSKYRNAVGTTKQAIQHSQYRAAKYRPPMAVDLKKTWNNTISNIVYFALQYRQPLAVEGREGCLWVQQLLSENGKEGEV